MAITYQMAQMILLEHKFRNISGNLMLLGRQTVFMTPDQAQNLVEKMGIKIRPESKIEYDLDTFGRQNNFISDRSFFSLFSDANVTSCDVSDYEGAEFVFDLSGNLPDELRGRFDFIYNGSVLDNVFDPASCIKNISKMLKSDGVVFHYEGVKHVGLTYLKFTPEWFFDYYSVNNFYDSQVYVMTYNDYFGDYSVLEYDAYYQDQNSSSDMFSPAMKIFGEAMVVVIAQNKQNSSVDKNPIQNTYRQSGDIYHSMYKNCMESSRRKSVRENISKDSRAAIDCAVRKSSFREKVGKAILGKAVNGCSDSPHEETLGYKFIGYANSIK